MIIFSLEVAWVKYPGLTFAKKIVEQVTWKPSVPTDQKSLSEHRRNKLIKSLSGSNPLHPSNDINIGIGRNCYGLYSAENKT